MITVVGIFEKRNGAERALRDLSLLGLEDGHVDLLSPGASKEQLSQVPTAECEPPGMAQTMGTLIGGAVGLGTGLSLGTAAAASFLLPGVGPVLALGSVAAVILGLSGAVGGSLAGKGVDRAVQAGLPEDEFFLYKDALRQGRSVLICLARDGTEANQVHRILEREGAESIDAARRRWWLGLRDLRRERYRAMPVQAPLDPFSRGFEAALNPEFRGKPWEQVVYLLAERYRDWYTDGFREGFDRGQLHYALALLARGDTPSV